MLSANIVRKHFPADVSPACLDGHTPLLNSLGTRADGPPSSSQIEALPPIRRCVADAAVIGIAVFGVCGLVPWHWRDPDQSMCVSRLYMA